MTTFVNQGIGTFDRKGDDQSAHHYAEVWFDEKEVKAFRFHSVGLHGFDKAYFRVHGVVVDARHIWDATTAFCCVTNITGVRPDGSEFFATWTTSHDGKVEEFHMGDKYGKAIARMTRTGYVQDAQHSAA